MNSHVPKDKLQNLSKQQVTQSPSYWLEISTHDLGHGKRY